MSYQDIKNDCLGKSIDIDGSYGAQCWDFACYVMEQYYYGKRCHCGITGYVQDIATQRKTNGILTFTDDVGLKAELVPGDICIWGPCAAAPLSHIAIYDHEDAYGNVYFLGENQPHPYVNIAAIPVQGIIAVFRPKRIKGAPASTVKWDYNAVLKPGDVVSSASCRITNYRDGRVYVPALGGWIPEEDLTEAKDTGDGANDNYLANLNARVYLEQTEVQKVDAKRNLVMVHGYWVDPTPLCKRVNV